MASAALPAVFPPMVVAGRRYLDGGVVNDVPVTRAVERGATHLVVLQTGVPEIPPTDPRRPFDAAVWAYWLARRNRLARDLAALPPEVGCTLLGPPRRPRFRYDDFSRSGGAGPPGLRRGRRPARRRGDGPLRGAAAGRPRRRRRGRRGR